MGVIVAPYKNSKQDFSDTLTIEWILQIKNYKLTLDKHRCVGCQICSLACPKEAVKAEKQANETPSKPKIDVDLTKCNFCGICDITCPFGAIKVTIDNVPNNTLIKKESYPAINRVINIDSKKCPKNCSDCEIACPLQLIKVSRAGFDGKPINDICGLSPIEKQRVRVTVDIQKEYCPTCKICESACPSKALKITKIFEGKLTINSTKCPSNCHNCAEICPIPNVLTVNPNGKVTVNETYCLYCGACKNVCPIETALIIKRTKVSHKRIHSGTWNKALERLTSGRDSVKELKAAASIKKRNIVLKRLQDEIN